MKTFLLATLLSLGLTAESFAQTTTSYKQETIEFIKLTGAASAFEKAIDQIGTMVGEDNQEAYKKEAQATLTPLYGDMADIYMAEFTQDEIKQLVVFYQSDLGKKLAQKQLALTQKAMSLGQSWGMEVQTIAQKYQ